MIKSRVRECQPPALKKQHKLCTLTKYRPASRKKEGITKHPDDELTFLLFGPTAQEEVVQVIAHAVSKQPLNDHHGGGDDCDCVFPNRVSLNWTSNSRSGNSCQIKHRNAGRCDGMFPGLLDVGVFGYERHFQKPADTLTCQPVHKMRSQWWRSRQHQEKHDGIAILLRRVPFFYYCPSSCLH